MLYSATYFNIKSRLRGIARAVFNYAAKMVQSYAGPPSDYVWCIAGGFASFINGHVVDYEDVDIYIIRFKEITPRTCVLEIDDADDFPWRFHIHEFGIDNHIDFIHSNLKIIESLLMAFDLDCCRHALVPSENTGFQSLYIQFMEIKPTPSIERIEKFSKRIFEDFDIPVGNNITSGSPLKIDKLLEISKFHESFENISKSTESFTCDF